MHKRWNKKYMYIAIAIAILLALLYVSLYFIFVRPLSDQVTARNQEAIQFEKQIKHLQKNENTKIGEDIAKAAFLVPPEKLPDDVLTQLEQVTQKNNTTIVSLAKITDKHVQEFDNENSEEDLSKFERVSYEIELTASTLNDFRLFLDTLLNAERFFLLEGIEVDQYGGEVGAIITVSVFYLK